MSVYTMSGKSKALQSVSKSRAICLACGDKPVPKGRRRYCGEKCKKRLDFALYIATGLVQALRARYAAFSYTEDTLLLDVLPMGSDVLSRFVWRRSNHRKVADDLLAMIEEAGRQWYEMEEETGSRWWASQHMLDRASRADIPASSILPIAKNTPSLNHREKDALRRLDLTKEQILSEDGMQSLKSAYRKKAKLHHPDRGDTSNTFVQISEAHAEILNWAQNPRFHSRRALPDSWCYDASKRRWAPPA